MKQNIINLIWQIQIEALNYLVTYRVIRRRPWVSFNSLALIMSTRLDHEGCFVSGPSDRAATFIFLACLLLIGWPSSSPFLRF